MITSHSPVLASSDVEASIAFYKEKLGFDSTWFWGEPTSFGGASSGTHMVMFNLQPELAARVEGHQIWFTAEDVNALHADHQERGAPVISEIENKPWGWREYTVLDPSGYHLRFAGHPDHVSAGSGVFPEGVQVIGRRPTVDEHAKVAGAEFYGGDVAEDILAQTWSGVVALSPDGETIGTLRIMRDAPGWYSVWDVAVSPDWQGQRIGTKMMEKALEMVRAESPGAFVHLYTFKSKFYERLGFTLGSVHQIKV